MLRTTAAVAPPELVVPFGVSEGQAGPADCHFRLWHSLCSTRSDGNGTASPAAARYLPMWLVDVDVTTRSGAEVGFDYEVVSHQALCRWRWLAHCGGA